MYTHQKTILEGGMPLDRADNVLILVHGRGGSAGDMLQLGRQLNLENFAFLAPQAGRNSWYPYSFMAPEQENQPALDAALDLLAQTLKYANDAGISSDRCFWLGFSQGACLTSEFVCRNAQPYGGVAALTGGIIGDRIIKDRYQGNFKETPILITTGDPDPHVPITRVENTVSIMEELGAQVISKVYKHKPHSISQEEMLCVQQLFK